MIYDVLRDVGCHRSHPFLKMCNFFRPSCALSRYAQDFETILEGEFARIDEEGDCTWCFCTARGAEIPTRWQEFGLYMAADLNKIQASTFCDSCGCVVHVVLSCFFPSSLSENCWI